MEYYSPSHDDYSLHDMIDGDISTDMELYHPHTDIKPQPAANLHNHLNMQNANIGFSDNHLKAGNFSIGVPHKVDVDTSLTNWLQSFSSNNQSPDPDNANPNLIVNPQTASPIGSTTNSVQSNITTRMLSLPNSVQIAGGNIQYVSTPSSTQHVYINTVKSSVGAMHAHTNGKPAFQRDVNGSFLLSPNSAPSSTVENPFPKPAYSYSCLIAMALKNSKHGSLPVAEIYNFMTRNFPYFKTAPDGWKNSVRHNLSLNKCFEKIENPNADGTNSRKGCLWALNPAKMKKMDEEIIKWNKKDPSAIKRAMAHPEILEMLEQGQELYLTGKYQVGRSGMMHHSQPPPQQHQQPQQQQTMANIHRIQPHSPSIRVVGSSPVMTQAVSTHQHLPIHHNGHGISSPSNMGSPAATNGHTNGNHHSQPQHTNVHNSGSSGGGNSKVLSEASELFSGHSELTLDPSLSDIAIQNGIWDDLPSDILDIPLNHSPTSFMVSPRKMSPAASPGQINSNGTGTMQIINNRSNGTQAHDFPPSRIVSAT